MGDRMSIETIVGLTRNRRKEHHGTDNASPSTEPPDSRLIQHILQVLDLHPGRLALPVSKLPIPLDPDRSVDHPRVQEQRRAEVHSQAVLRHSRDRTGCLQDFLRQA